MAGERKDRIAEIIRRSDAPVTGGELSRLLGVTRQVVVQDVAVLRAAGAPIIATPSGYIMIDHTVPALPVKVFTCRHETLAQAEEELMLIVMNGGKVRDVIIEHPVYGEITGSLMLDSAGSVRQLIERLGRGDAQMLSSTTGGVHMHTVEARDEATLERIEKLLAQAGILAGTGIHTEI